MVEISGEIDKLIDEIEDPWIQDKYINWNIEEAYETWYCVALNDGEIW